jgi:DNA-binding transcriptional MerR regulator
MEKLYYSIGDVSKLVNEEKYILRYWESEFAELCPKKNSAGNRSYTDDDIQVIRSIQELLRKQQITLKDAKEILPTMTTPQKESTEMQNGGISEEVVNELATVVSSMAIADHAISSEEKQRIITLLKEIKHFLQT